MTSTPLPDDTLSRNFYRFAIFLAGLYAAVATFQNHLLFQTAGRTAELPSLLSWVALFVLLQVAGSLVALYYFYHKQYWFPCWSAVLVILTSLGQFFIFYRMISGKTSHPLYTPALLFVLGANVLWGVSLVATRAGKRPFLKAAGGLSAGLGAVFLFIVIGGLQTEDIQLKVALAKGYAWAAWAGPVIPVLFGLNFWHALKQLRYKPATLPLRMSPLRIAANFLMAGTAVTALVFSVRLGQTMSEEARVVMLPPYVSEKERARAERFEARTFVNGAGDTLPYRLLKPLHYDPQRRYPLVVCLHGGGQYGRDNVRQIEGSEAPFLAHYLNREKYSAFLFVPQAPVATTWLDPTVERLLMQALPALEREFSIDTDRRYIVGASAGGYGAWHLAGTYPDAFAAIIPLCGDGNPQLGPKLAGVPVWAFHGEKDESVPVQGSRRMIEAIRKAGGKPRYTEFAGVGHDIGREFRNTPGVLDWLFAQRRK